MSTTLATPQQLTAAEISTVRAWTASHPIVRVDWNRSLAPMTTYGLGGPAEVLLTIPTVATLQSFMGLGLRAWILGNGSNVLVSDEGVAGCVVRLSGEFDRVEPLGHGRLYAGAAAKVSLVIRAAHEWGLAGLELWAGIPATMGGVVVMNGGTRAGDGRQVLESVDVILPGGERATIPSAEMGLAYRSTLLPPGAVVIGATMQLQPATGDALDAARKAMRDELVRRVKTQPYSDRSCGSVFKNPAGDHAARLIEQAGLKGFTYGGLKVSDRHSNFIVVADEHAASAQGCFTLIQAVRARVTALYGVKLVPEVQFIGPFATAAVGEAVARMAAETNPRPQSDSSSPPSSAPHSSQRSAA